MDFWIHYSFLRIRFYIFHVFAHIVHHIPTFMIFVSSLKWGFFQLDWICVDVLRSANFDCFHFMEFYWIVPVVVRQPISWGDGFLIVFEKLNPGWKIWIREKILFSLFNLEIWKHFFYLNTLVGQSISTFQYISNKLSCLHSICYKYFPCCNWYTFAFVFTNG